MRGLTRTSRKQVEKLLASKNEDGIEYRLVSHQHLGNAVSYSYTYSVCIFVDGKHEKDLINNTSLKEIADILRRM